MAKKMSKPRDLAGLSVRSAAVAAPATLDAASRSLRVVMATEQPVTVWDWERMDYVPEVLLVSGMQAPSSGQVPFLDSHARFSVDDVLGSARDFNPVDVSGVRGVDACVSFSTTDDGEQAFVKFREGHLTDVSVGYAVLARTFVEAGVTAVVEGRNFTGPVSIVSKWALRELSAAPIGADALAKARALHQRQGGDAMNKKLRKLLEERGLAPDATGEQAQAFYEAMSEAARKELLELSERAETPSGTAPAPGGNPASAPADNPAAAPADPGRAAPGESPEAIAQRAARAERERAASIRSNCRSLGLDDSFADALVAEGVQMEAARAKMIEKAAERGKPLGGHVSMGATDAEKFRSAVVDGMAYAAGVRSAGEKQYAPGYEAFRAMGIQMLVRECLERCGERTARLTSAQLAGRAMGTATTSDFPNILANVAYKVARKAYEEAPATWTPFCSTNPAKDFKNMDRPQLSGFSDLDLIGEDGEYKAGKLSDSKESYAIKSYGKLFGLSRQAIINDDLGMFLRLPRLFGAAARRKQSDLVYAIFNSNPAMGADGLALFHTNHGNLAASGSSIGQTSLSAARAAMLKQTDPAGSRLNLQPKYLLVGPDNQTDAEIILRSVSQVQDNRSSGVVNVFHNSLIPIVEARLDKASAEPWYLVADSSQIDTIEVSFLDGNDAPFIDEAIEFSADLVKYKVRIDFGVAPLDHRGFYMNPGV